MKTQDMLIIGGAAFAVWWLLKRYGNPDATAAAAPRYWVTGGTALPDQFTTWPDPGAKGSGVWV